jgi:hypothetical protein
MENDEDWQLNVKSKTKKINLNNLLIIDTNDFKIKNVTINKEYLQEKYDNLLNSYHNFINFDENSHYLNFSESEYEFMIDNNSNRLFNIDNFSRISYNEVIEKSKIDISKMTLNKWLVESSFRIKNMISKKILNIFIYSFYNAKKNITFYGILTYYDRSNVFLMLLSSYIELLLYIYKIECEMGKQPRLSKVINKYPYDFNNLNLNDIKNYFNNLPKIWINDK